MLDNRLLVWLYSFSKFYAAYENEIHVTFLAINVIFRYYKHDALSIEKQHKFEHVYLQINQICDVLVVVFG